MTTANNKKQHIKPIPQHKKKEPFPPKFTNQYNLLKSFIIGYLVTQDVLIRQNDQINTSTTTKSLMVEHYTSK